MKSNKTPQIRFKGFTDAWEQRELWEKTTWDKKFNEVDSKKQNVIRKYKYALAETLSKIEDANGEIPMIACGVGKTKYTTKEKAAEYLDNAEIVAIPWGGTPNIKYNKGFFVTSDNRIAQSSDKEKLSTKYLFYYLMANINTLASFYRGASIKHPSMKDVLDMKLMYPVKMDEQIQICQLLETLDNLITCHQRKHEKIINIKKALLEKMFPNNEEKFPQIRFEEFADAWEQREFGKFSSVLMNRRIFKHQTSENGEVPFYKIGTFGGIADAFIPYDLFQEYKEKYPYPQVGDILISASGSIGKIVEYKGENEYFQDSNIVWLSHKGTLDNSFLKAFYQIVRWSGLEGSTIQRLYNKNILETIISYPLIQEQSKIGELFKTLDNLITCHQRKIDKLKNIKKSLLEKMFI